MAAISSKYPFGSAQEHIPTCEKHDLMIDMTCEDCEEFICSQCAKIDHKDHNWKTISTAGIQRRKELKKTLSKVKEKDLKEMDDKIKKSDKLMDDNRKFCDSEVFKLQKHYDEIVSKLDEIKKNVETKLRENLERKNAEVREKKLDLEKKTKQVIDLVNFLEENHSTMSDYSLIDNLRDLTNLNSNRDKGIENGGHSVRYRIGDINEGFLEDMMGQTFDFDDITATETESFNKGDKNIVAMEAINEETCYIREFQSKCIEQVYKNNKKGKRLDISGAEDVCVTDNGDVYVPESVNACIARFSQSGAVSTAFSTAPLKPLGICQSTESGMLVLLMDVDSEIFKPDSNSRRLVRHVTLTGDVIREYEYQEDGQTRLFIYPWRVRQNGNTDICVVDWTSKYAGELVILSSSGSLRSRYTGQNLVREFKPTDVVCDCHCNIIVNDLHNSKIHLLCPYGEFIKYLLSENELRYPFSMCLYKSTLWVGDIHGLIKVFQLFTYDKPVTRRGLLSKVNGIFDPLDFLAPVTIYGKLFLRKLVAQTQTWDEPLPDELASLWNPLECSLIVFEYLRIQHTYVTYLSKAVTKELHVFSDASGKATAAVTYLRATDSKGPVKLGFVLGKTKVAPISGHTIPRLELCAFVLAVEIAQLSLEHLDHDLQIDCVMYYADSSQWSYIPTDRNLAARCLPAAERQDSSWL